MNVAAPLVTTEGDSADNWQKLGKDRTKQNNIDKTKKTQEVKGRIRVNE